MQKFLTKKLLDQNKQNIMIQKLNEENNNSKYKSKEEKKYHKSYQSLKKKNNLTLLTEKNK